MLSGLKLWTLFARDAARFERQRLLSESPLAFRWAAGELVRALREGEWVLLDEINLAPAETLQRLAGLLDGSEGTLTLPERVEGGGSDDEASVSDSDASDGDDDDATGAADESKTTSRREKRAARAARKKAAAAGIKVKRHPNFRIFAAMNPASDVGKRDLPPALRHRFTEIFVDEMLGVNDLCLVATQCVAPLGLDRDKRGTYVDCAVNFYLEMRNVVSVRSRGGGGGGGSATESQWAAQTQRARANGPVAKRMAAVCAELRGVEIGGASGAGQVPTFSLRTLCRAIALAVALVQRHNGVEGKRDVIGMAFYAGFNTCFASQLEAHIDDKSVARLRNAMRLAFAPMMATKQLLRKFPTPRDQHSDMVGGGGDEGERRASKAERRAAKRRAERAAPEVAAAEAALDAAAAEAAAAPTFVEVEGVFLKAGPHTRRDLSEPDLLQRRPPSFVRTPSSSRVLRALARAAVLRDVPVLLQGPTSSGKTSTVKYLAALTGHRCIRINNHEHTELSEYIGSYGTDPHTGALAFREGPLVDAVRNGHWIVLDELNLAPSEGALFISFVCFYSFICSSILLFALLFTLFSEVLEALNRLLDDNRELLIGETQQTIRAHPSFMLFATQNPSGCVCVCACASVCARASWVCARRAGAFHVALLIRLSLLSHSARARALSLSLSLLSLSLSLYLSLSLCSLCALQGCVRWPQAALTRAPEPLY